MTMDDLDDLELEEELAQISNTIDNIVGKVRVYEAEFHNGASEAKTDDTSADQQG